MLQPRNWAEYVFAPTPDKGVIRSIKGSTPDKRFHGLQPVIILHSAASSCSQLCDFRHHESVYRMINL